jgi:hypothetical protein
VAWLGAEDDEQGSKLEGSVLYGWSMFAAWASRRIARPGSAPSGPKLHFNQRAAGPRQLCVWSGGTAAPPCMFPAARCETQAPRELLFGIWPLGIGRLGVPWCEMGEGATGGGAKLRHTTLATPQPSIAMNPSGFGLGSDHLNHVSEEDVERSTDIWLGTGGTTSLTRQALMKPSK